MTTKTAKRQQIVSAKDALARVMYCIKLIGNQENSYGGSMKELSDDELTWRAFEWSTQAVATATRLQIALFDECKAQPELRQKLVDAGFSLIPRSRT